MVKGTAACLVLLMILSMSTFAYAKEAKGSHKLVRGVVDVITAPVELPKQIYKATKESNPFVGITVGTLKGAGNLVTKALSGAFNIITFPFPKLVAEAELFPEKKPEPEEVK